MGNPGKAYINTRHNAGFLLCDFLYPGASWQTKFHSLYAKEDGIILLKPQTYMNLSGIATSEATSFFHIKCEEVLVVHDDLELPLGTVKLQLGGGMGGHNGLRSIKERLGSDCFYRLRIGIGRPKHGDVALFVTSPFTEDEQITFSHVLDEAAKLLKNGKEGSAQVSLPH